MKKTGFIVTIVVLAIIIIALGVGLFLVFNDKQKIEEDNKKLNETINTLQQEVKDTADVIDELNEMIDELKNDANNGGNNNPNDQLTEEDYVREAFEKYLRKAGGLEEYKIENIKILNREELEENFGEDVLQFEDSIAAEVTYSVKPAEEEFDNWVAANGEVEEDWIRNKFNVVEVANSERGYEVVNAGTSW